MMKLFRVHHVHANGLETLALTVSAGGLKSAPLLGCVRLPSRSGR